MATLSIRHRCRLSESARPYAALNIDKLIADERDFMVSFLLAKKKLFNLKNSLLPLKIPSIILSY